MAKRINLTMAEKSDIIKKDGKVWSDLATFFIWPGEDWLSQSEPGLPFEEKKWVEELG